MNSIDRFSSRLRSARRSRICAWIGDVERGGGLVRDQSSGLLAERHGDHHALPLPARKLMRDRRRGRVSGLRMPTRSEKLEDALPHRLALQALVELDGLAAAASRWCGAG
jgi:hypothetical protein